MIGAHAPKLGRRIDREERPAARRARHRQRRARDRREAQRGADRPRRAPLRGPHPDRGRSGGRQDDAGQGAEPEPRLLVPTHPVHPRPAAVGRDRPLDLQPEDGGVRVPARTDHGPGRPGRRDQPRHAEDPERPARVHGGAPGHDRRRHLPDAVALPRHRDPEPDRVRGHLRPAGGTARSVHAPPAARLSEADGGDRHPRRAEAHAPDRVGRAGARSRGAARDAVRDQGDLRRSGRRRVHRSPRGGDSRAPRRLPGRLAARLAQPLPRVAGVRRAGRARLRDPRRREAAGGGRPGTPPHREEPGVPAGGRSRADREGDPRLRPVAEAAEAAEANRAQIS